MAKKKLPASFQPIKKGAKISDEDKKKLETHGKKHGKQHMASMRMSILKGSSFDDAHKNAKSRGYK
tara:strand:+ start:474 stop:671 length:198 start_codon:yes stop_codon:yes gene_type:complete